MVGHRICECKGSARATLSEFAASAVGPSSESDGDAAVPEIYLGARYMPAAADADAARRAYDEATRVRRVAPTLGLVPPDKKQTSPADYEAAQRAVPER